MSGIGQYIQTQFLQTSAGGNPYPTGFDKVHDIVVTKAGNDTTGDGSWGNPFLTIGKGIGVVGDGYSVWIGDGTYNEHLSKTSTACNLYSISDDYTKCIIDGTSSGRIWGVSAMSSSLPTQMKGLTFQNGLANDGGAIHGNTSGGYVITNCKFYNNGTNVNYSGGAIHCGHLINIEDCVFDSNFAHSGSGCAIYCSAYGHLTANRCTFSNNSINVRTSGDNGNAIFFFDSGVGTARHSIITNCVFTGNTGGERGGAVYVYKVAGDLTIRDCLAYDNSVTYGGAFLSVKALPYGVNGVFTMEHCTVVDNLATVSTYEAVELYATGLTISNLILYKNIDYASNYKDVRYAPSLTINNSFMTELWTGLGSNNLDEITSANVVGFTDYANNDFTIDSAVSDCYQAADDGTDMGTRYFTELV